MMIELNILELKYKDAGIDQYFAMLTELHNLFVSQILQMLGIIM
jgi:hypothetical protein